MNTQPWSDEVVARGRIFLVTDNPVSRALVQLAAVVGRPASVLLDESALADLRAVKLTERDAVVLCDHDTPDSAELLRHALTSPTGYVAMLGSRRRAQATYVDLAVDLTEDALARFHIPAGLNLGGKAPGEISLSVLAEIVAESYGRAGGPMRIG